MRFPKHVFKAQKLTKASFMSLRAGPFLVGNICDGLHSPAFAEPIVPKQQREQQWARIKEAGANGRVCDVFKSREVYEGYVQKRQFSAQTHGYGH